MGSSPFLLSLLFFVVVVVVVNVVVNVILVCASVFLDASSHLYKRVCRLVGRYVGW